MCIPLKAIYVVNPPFLPFPPHCFFMGAGVGVHFGTEFALGLGG